MKAPARLLVPVCALVLGVFAAQPVRASDGEARDLATATALFQRGKALVDLGHYAEACPMFEQAQRLVLGIGVTLYLADCYEQSGRLTPAWEQFDKARQLAESNHDARAGIARERAERLWPKLPKLLIVVPPSVDVPGLELTEDDVTVEHAAYNKERPADPGTHWFRARAPDRAPWESSAEVPVSAGTVRVEVPPLAERARSLVSAGAPPSMLRPIPMESSRPMPTQRVWGLAVLGVGVVSLTVSAVLGLEAKSQMDASNASGHCQPNDHCDAVGLAERSDAISKATWSTVAAVGGVACAVGGAFLYFSAHDVPPSGVALAARPQQGGVRVVLEGRW